MGITITGVLPCITYWYTTITNITANVDAALTDRAGIEQAIASALIQAQKRGMKVIL